MRVLMVDAHPDDAEISCAGTISKLKSQGAIVWSIYFCPCTEDPKNEGHLDDHHAVCQLLKVDKLIENEFFRDTLEEHRQEVRNILYKIREEFKPDLVLCPSTHDFHQDHKAIAECCLTIFRDTSTILGYEVLRSVAPEFTPNYYVILEGKDITMKMDVVATYKSQVKNRPYFFTPRRFLSQMEMRGTQIKTDFAEAYEFMWGRENYDKK